MGCGCDSSQASGAVVCPQRLRTRGGLRLGAVTTVPIGPGLRAPGCALSAGKCAAGDGGMVVPSARVTQGAGCVFVAPALLGSALTSVGHFARL